MIFIVLTYQLINSSTYQLINLSTHQLIISSTYQLQGEWFFAARENADVGLYIETKRPSYYRSIGLPLEEKLAESLDQAKWEGPVIIQSFEKDSLMRFKELKPHWKRVISSNFFTIYTVLISSNTSLANRSNYSLTKTFHWKEKTHHALI